jgi:hypothetical protein
MSTKIRNWDVLLIGGASGVGKTNVSLPLARHYGVDLVRVVGLLSNVGCLKFKCWKPARGTALLSGY